MCDSSGIFVISWKRKQGSSTHENIQSDAETLQIERKLIKIDCLSPNNLKDNVFYDISSITVRTLFPNLQCSMCTQELLLDPTDPMPLKRAEFPVYARFSHCK